MIKLPFIHAVAIYISFLFVLVFGGWLLYNFKKNGSIKNPSQLIHCPYCAFLFFSLESKTRAPDRKNKTKKGLADDFKESEHLNFKSPVSIIQCPRCASYINLNKEHKEKEA